MMNSMEPRGSDEDADMEGVKVLRSEAEAPLEQMFCDLTTNTHTPPGGRTKEQVAVHLRQDGETRFVQTTRRV